MPEQAYCPYYFHEFYNWLPVFLFSTFCYISSRTVRVEFTIVAIYTINSLLLAICSIVYSEFRRSFAFVDFLSPAQIFHNSLLAVLVAIQIIMRSSKKCKSGQDHDDSTCSHSWLILFSCIPTCKSHCSVRVENLCKLALWFTNHKVWYNEIICT